MWSQPDIRALNARAKSCATAYDKESAPPKRHKHQCEFCTEKATHHDKWYDIFSEDAKGVRHLCTKHFESGAGDEGYFTCDCCGRLMVENYTWEYYRVIVDGEVLCLPCAAKLYFSDDDNLIDPAKLTAVTNDEGPLWNPETGVVCLRGVRHVLGVDQPVPEGISCVDRFENCNERGLFDGEEIKAKIKELGKPCFLVLDGAYQFSGSIGLYIRE